MLTNLEDFSQLPGYQEAKHGKGRVHIGRRQHLYRYWQDVMTHGHQSQYLGSVLCPEFRGEIWNYEENKAFLAGVIEAGREVVLESDISTEFGAIRNGYTGDELLWLQDNGYIFAPDPENPSLTIAIPPAVRTSVSIVHYNKEKGREDNIRQAGQDEKKSKDDFRKARNARIDSIITHVFQQRTQQTYDTPLTLITHQNQ
jgi:hypothetical protein